MSAPNIPGFSALQCVISSLRDTAHFADEEGDLTNKLRELRDWLCARTPSSPATEPDDRGEREEFEKILDNVRTQVFDTLKDWHKINVAGHEKDHRRLWMYMRNVEGFLGCLARGDYDADRAPTAPAPTEPVGWQRFDDISNQWTECSYFAAHGFTSDVPLPGFRAVYATPPSAAAQPEAVGWKRVPIEPTTNMMNAAMDCQDADPEDGLSGEIYATYKAMLAAAPTTEATSSPSDAERHRLVRRGQHWSVIDGIGNVLRGNDLDAAIDAIHATKGGEL